MQITKINNKPLTIKEYNGQRVLMFKDIDKAHGRPDGTAGRAFRSNRKHFIENADYYKISPDEFRRTIGDMDKRQTNSVYVITESGYLMLAKSFTDDLAWTVQRQLVNCYFRCKEQAVPEQLTLEENNHLRGTLEAIGYRYQDKTFNGEPVVTLNDIAFHTGVSPDTARGLLRRYGKYGKDYYKIDGAQIIKFKQQNTGCPHTWNHLILVTKSGFMLIAEYYNLTKNTPQCFIEDKKPQPPEYCKENRNRITPEDVERICKAAGMAMYNRCVYDMKTVAECISYDAVNHVIDVYNSDKVKYDNIIETFVNIVGCGQNESTEFSLKVLTRKGVEFVAQVHNVFVLGKRKEGNVTCTALAV